MTKDSFHRTQRMLITCSVTQDGVYGYECIPMIIAREFTKNYALVRFLVVDGVNAFVIYLSIAQLFKCFSQI